MVKLEVGSILNVVLSLHKQPKVGIVLLAVDVKENPCSAFISAVGAYFEDIVGSYNEEEAFFHELRSLQPPNYFGSIDESGLRDAIFASVDSNETFCGLSVTEHWWERRDILGRNLTQLMNGLFVRIYTEGRSSGPRNSLYPR